MIILLETYGNLIQLTLFMTMCVILIMQLSSSAKPLAVCFTIGGLFCAALGDIFYLLYGTLYKAVVPYFSASDIAWIGCFCFFIAANHVLAGTDKRAPWYAYVMTAIVNICSVLLMILWGEIVINIIWLIPLAVLTWSTAKGIHQTKKASGNEKNRLYFIMMAMFITGDMILFFSRGTMYYIMDVIMTMIVLLVGISSLICTRNNTVSKKKTIFRLESRKQTRAKYYYARVVFLFFIIGIAVCLAAAYVNSFMMQLFCIPMDEVAIFLTPITEEFLKMLPILLYFLLKRPTSTDILLSAISVGIGFATLENLNYVISGMPMGTEEILIRLLAVSAMHTVDTLCVGFGIVLLMRVGSLAEIGAIGIFYTVVIYHSVYNLCVSLSGISRFCGYLMPITTLLLISLAGLFGYVRRKKEVVDSEIK